jgi:SAM-dependent methyltransferase
LTAELALTQIGEDDRMASDDWGKFYRITRDNPAWPLLTRAAALARKEGRALDLGAGGGRDTRYLLAEGFQVTAVDAQPRSVALLASLPEELKPLQERLRVAQSRFEDFAFEPGGYDLINAQFALPFMAPSDFVVVFGRIKDALAPGGVFAGQFFGDHDEWNTPETIMTFVTRAQAEKLLDGLRTIKFRELEEDGHVADGRPKHWHVFHILARKPA